MAKTVNQYPSYDWESFNSVKRWKKELRNKNLRQILSPQTWRTYSRYFPDFLIFTDKTPDELIEECLIDSEIGYDRVSDYYKKLSERCSMGTAIVICFGAIRGFYTHNKINTKFWNSPKIPVRDVEKTDEELPLFVRSESKKLVLNREVLLPFLKKLNDRDESIALGMLSSGMDIGDILNLKISDVKYQIDDRLYFHNQRPKTGEEYKTFWSKEATKKVRIYCEYHRLFAKDSDYLFVSSQQNTKIENVVIERNFRYVARYLHIKLITLKQSPLRPKRFRKCFQSGCQYAGLPIQTIQTFMGQKGEQVKTYMGKSKEELLSYYEQAEPHLTVYEDIVTNSDFMILQKRVESLQNEKNESIQKFMEILSAVSKDRSLLDNLFQNLKK
ncbi:hypothetical protein YTPLAS73_12990 [Nitrosarchaeum sp.]|nr:hypothetical protein YTPLAS73_12990 [Nitrosarchaeum sp.]